MKRGQITLFVILGIIIVAVIGVGIFFRQSIMQQELGAEAAVEETLIPEVQQFDDSVYECIDSVIMDNILLIGIKGGYINTPESYLYLKEDDLAIPYYYDKAQNRVPKTDKVAEELAKAIDAESEACIDREAFPSLTITPGQPVSAVTMADDGIDIMVDYPIQVSSGEQIYSLTGAYDYSYDIRLKSMLDAANRITAKKIESKDDLDMEYLLQFGYEINIIPIDNNTEVYMVTDLGSMIDDGGYSLIYANRF